MAQSTKPIVIGYHLMWTLYGWWLPNDPRGSTSNALRNDLLADLGALHHGRKSIQPSGRDIRAFYEQAAAVLKHELLSFTPEQLPLVAQAIGEVVVAHNYTCYACAIMPDHVHILIRKHRHLAEEMIQNFQSLSRKRLSSMGVRGPDHPTWTQGGWKVFLDHPDDIRRTIRYIENNPIKSRWPVQRCGFVREYDNWPLHEGHSPHSPYANALKRIGRYPR